MDKIGKEEMNLSFFANSRILYLKHTKNSTIKLLDPINTFRNVSEYKINIQK
jgi:hypothetical protein